MEFLKIKQEDVLTSKVIFTNLSSELGISTFYQKIEYDMLTKQCYNFQTNNTNAFDYYDILFDILFLISPKFKVLLNLYDKKIKYIPITIEDKKIKLKKLYYLPFFNVVEYNDEIDYNIIKNNAILKTYTNFKLDILVRLDLAESICRRNFKGIVFENINNIVNCYKKE